MDYGYHTAIREYYKDIAPYLFGENKDLAEHLRLINGGIF